MKHLVMGIVLVVLVGCGGHRSSALVQEGAQTAKADSAPEITPNEESATALSQYQDDLLPLLRTGGGDFQIAGLPSPKAADARHMPIYHDGKHLFVGVDQGTGQIGFLPSRYREEGIEFLYGHLFDGAGGGTVAAYLNEAMRSRVPWNKPPTVRVIGPASSEDVARTIRAVQLINAALPEHAKLQVGAALPSVSLRENISVSTYSPSGQELPNTIHVEWIPGADYRRLRGSRGRTGAFGVNLGDANGYIGFNMGANSYPRDHEATILLAHELLHALADFGHVPAQFASILEGTGDIHHPGQNVQRRPLSLLYPADREALQAFFGRLQGGFGPMDFGPWSEESLHIAGRSPHAAFGVALRNDYAEPWAYGYRPGSDLADNRALSGNATWKGDLLGLTPKRDPVWGNAGNRRPTGNAGRTRRLHRNRGLPVACGGMGAMARRRSWLHHRRAREHVPRDWRRCRQAHRHLHGPQPRRGGRHTRALGPHRGFRGGEGRPMKWLLLAILVFSDGDEFITLSMTAGPFETKYKCELMEKSWTWNLAQGGGGKLTDIPGFEHQHKVCVKLGE